jgi:ubiquinone/menaquinone biosynthesis C-methylase UbiE
LKTTLVSKISPNSPETSQNYDVTRKPVGLDKILEFSKSLKKPLNELSLLDCGCGSGNYLVELSKYFGSVTGIGSLKSF